jgi:hypothetical protein
LILDDDDSTNRFLDALSFVYAERLCEIIDSEKVVILLEGLRNSGRVRVATDPLERFSAGVINIRIRFLSGRGGLSSRIANGRQYPLHIAIEVESPIVLVWNPVFIVVGEVFFDLAIHRQVPVIFSSIIRPARRHKSGVIK